MVSREYWITITSYCGTHKSEEVEEDTDSLHFLLADKELFKKWEKAKVVIGA